MVGGVGSGEKGSWLVSSEQKPDNSVSRDSLGWQEFVGDMRRRGLIGSC